jgi:hypothetical protein
MQDLVAGLATSSSSGGVAGPDRHSHRVRFGVPSASSSEALGAAELGSSGLYDSDDDEKSMGDSVPDGTDEDDAAAVSRARSPPEEMDDTVAAALPHNHEAIRRAAAQAAQAAEDPLYDPHADEDDEEWLRAKVQRRAPQSRQQRTKGPGKTATAAAAAAARAAAAEAEAAAHASPHLSCPACFTPLCFDCQRHASRPNAFRAMFVTNDVLVDKGRQVRPEPGTEDEHDRARKFYAVLCKTCKTHVAVMDDEEVFHFFNVLESQA